MSIDEKALQNAEAWPANIVVERHEVSGKWVLWYLTDEQAALCQRALPRLAAKAAQQPDVLTQRLKAVPIKAFLRLNTGHAFISAELPIGELCHEAAEAIATLNAMLKNEQASRRSPKRESVDECEYALIYDTKHKAFWRGDGKGYTLDHREGGAYRLESIARQNTKLSCRYLVPWPIGTPSPTPRLINEIEGGKS